MDNPQISVETCIKIIDEELFFKHTMFPAKFNPNKSIQTNKTITGLRGELLFFCNICIMMWLLIIARVGVFVLCVKTNFASMLNILCVCSSRKKNALRECVCLCQRRTPFANTTTTTIQERHSHNGVD